MAKEAQEASVIRVEVRLSRTVDWMASQHFLKRR